MSLIVSAPGKIHLLGEHTVVYGKPALLAALDKRLFVQIKKHELRSKNKDKEKLKINSPEGNSLILCAIDVFKKAFTIDKLPPIEINISSQIPIGSGLGSSAALSAAIIGGLMKCIKNIWNPEKINGLAYEVEKIAHGNPSGADNTTVVFGGLVWYRKEFEFLKSIWNLPISSYKIPRCILIDTGRPVESTKEMVSAVAALYNKKRRMMDDIFANQERQTKRVLLALRNNNKDEFADALRSGERNLEMMDIVGEKAKKIIREIEKAEGVAKVCGAGGKKKGSGILFCYHKNLRVLMDIGEKHRIEAIPAKLGEEGIRTEKQS